jgi:hypothetical protein
MTPSELKYKSLKEEPHFFTHSTMKFFGDRMSNYGVRDGGTIKTYSGEEYQVWELWRKRAVKHGLKDSAYFDKITFKRVFPAKGE